MAKTVNPQQMAQNWANAMASPTTSQKYTQGIQGVTQSPGAAAATDQALARYQAGCAASVASGKRAASLQYSLQSWQQAAIQKGAPRLASGAQMALPKFQAFAQKWAPIYQQASAAAHALPKGGLGNAMARVQATISVLMQAAGTA